MNNLYERAPFEIEVDLPTFGKQTYRMFSLKAASDMFASDRKNGFSSILTFRRQFDSERLVPEVRS